MGRFRLELALVLHPPCSLLSSDVRRPEIDTLHLGSDRVIAAHLVDGLIVDPGPASALENWIDELDEEPRGLLLTHIHLDHAGATGVLVRRLPELRVYVSAVGAPHLADPSKLLASAGRLYGEENMERLWGEVAPVPERESGRARRRGGGRGLPGRAHARPRRPPPLLPRPRERRRLRRRHGRGADPARRAHARADPAAGDRRRGLARVGRPDRGAAARAPAPDPLRRRRGAAAQLERVRASLRANAERARARRSRAVPGRARGRDRGRGRPGDREQPAPGDAARAATGSASSATGASARRPRRPATEIPRPHLATARGVQGCPAATLPPSPR